MNKRHIIVVLFVLVLIISLQACNHSRKKKVFDTKPVSIKTFNTPPGADPDVPAELGGKGFTGEGWNTKSDYNILGDLKAIKGGRFTISMRDFPITIRTEGKDNNTDANGLIETLLYETLLNLDPVTGEFIPQLATHWQVLDDKVTYRFRLDPDARFADGKPVTTQDVISSWELVSNPEILDPFFSVMFQGYEKPVAESKYIIKIKSKEIGWSQFYFLATALKIYPSHYIGGIAGKDYLEKYQYRVIPGTGPYIIDSNDIKKDNSLIIRRRSDYWAEEKRFATGLNNFDEIKIDINRDENLELEKFKKGEIDILKVTRAQVWAEKFNFDEVKRGLVVKKKIFNEDPVGVSGLALNMRKPPFNDIRIRKAFTYLYDRQKFNEKLFYNSYWLISSFFPGTIYENPSNPKPGFNLDSAKMLLAEAGWKDKNPDGYLVKDGKIFEIDMPFSKGMDRYLTIFQEDLKKAGIKLNLSETDAPTLFKLGNERNFTIINISWSGMPVPNPDSYLSSASADNVNSTNWPGVKDAKIDELISKYNGAFEREERIKYLRQIDEIACSYFPYVFGWYGPYQRIAFQNKFGYPECILSRTDNFLISAIMWYNDPYKVTEFEEALLNKEINFPIQEEDVKYWIDLRSKLNSALK